MSQVLEKCVTPSGIISAATIRRAVAKEGAGSSTWRQADANELIHIKAQGIVPKHSASATLLHVSLVFQLLGNFNLLTQPLCALLSPLLPPSLPALAHSPPPQAAPSVASPSSTPPNRIEAATCYSSKQLRNDYGLASKQASRTALPAQLAQLKAWLQSEVQLDRLGRPLADSSWQGVYKSVNGFLGFCCNVLKNRVSWKTTYMLPYCANLVAARSLS